MKKLSLVFALVVLCITAQAQDRSQLVSKWKIDKDLTFEHNPTFKEQYNNSDDKGKAFFSIIFTMTIECSDNGDFEAKTAGRISKGTWKLENDELKTSTSRNGGPLKNKSLKIIHIDKNSLVLKDDKEMSLGFKRVK